MWLYVHVHIILHTYVVHMTLYLYHTLYMYVSTVYYTIHVPNVQHRDWWNEAYEKYKAWRYLQKKKNVACFLHSTYLPRLGSACTVCIWTHSQQSVIVSKFCMKTKWPVLESATLANAISIQLLTEDRASEIPKSFDPRDKVKSLMTGLLEGPSLLTGVISVMTWTGGGISSTTSRDSTTIDCTDSVGSLTPDWDSSDTCLLSKYGSTTISGTSGFVVSPTLAGESRPLSGQGESPLKGNHDMVTIRSILGIYCMYTILVGVCKVINTSRSI